VGEGLGVLALQDGWWVRGSPGKRLQLVLMLSSNGKRKAQCLAADVEVATQSKPRRGERAEWGVEVGIAMPRNRKEAAHSEGDTGAKGTGGASRGHRLSKAIALFAREE